MQEHIEIGEIVNTHGVKGALKVLPLTDDPQRYGELKWVYISMKGVPKRHDVEEVRYFKGFVILKLKEINDMSAAEKYKGAFIEIDRENAVKLPPDSYFIFDLIDSEVFDEKGEKLGELKEVLQTGSNDVYVVRNESGGEILIPALKSIVTQILTEEKKITVTLPKGLVEE